VESEKVLEGLEVGSWRFGSGRLEVWSFGSWKWEVEVGSWKVGGGGLEVGTLIVNTLF